MGGGSGVLCSVTLSCPTFCDLMDYITSQATLSMGFFGKNTASVLKNWLGEGLFLISNFPHYSRTDFCI